MHPPRLSAVKCRLPPMLMHRVRGLQREALVCSSAVGFCVPSTSRSGESFLPFVLPVSPNSPICRAAVTQQTKLEASTVYLRLHVHASSMLKAVRASRSYHRPVMARPSFSKAYWRLHSFCLVLALGSFVWG